MAPRIVKLPWGLGGQRTASMYRAEYTGPRGVCVWGQGKATAGALAQGRAGCDRRRNCGRFRPGTRTGCPSASRCVPHLPAPPRPASDVPLLLKASPLPRPILGLLACACTGIGGQLALRPVSLESPASLIVQCSQIASASRQFEGTRVSTV